MILPNVQAIVRSKAVKIFYTKTVECRINLDLYEQN
jgi:hypothetical protein